VNLAIAAPNRDVFTATIPQSLEQFSQQIRHEWTIGSAIDVTLFERTVEVVPDTFIDSYTHEPSYPIHEALNWQLTRFGHQARQTEFAALIHNDDGEVWQAKLSNPRLDRAKGKQRKYEMPKGSTSRAWLPKEMPLHLWQRIAKKFDAALTETDLQLGFRAWLEQHHQIPVIICEGAKKAAALLTLGYAAIALPGIFNGYRKETQCLIEDLQQLAGRDRPIYLCFDHDLKPKTIESVNLATWKLGTLFAQAGCQVRVIQLPGPEKGVDDYLVARGEVAFAKLFRAAVELDKWHVHQPWELTYKVNLRLNHRYLQDLPYPNAGFAFVKSPKGTGKTKALEPLIHQAIQTGRKVLVVTHRIQLGRAICNQIGIDWSEELHRSQTQGLLGYGLCIDSLHPYSRVRFNPEDWRGAIVIFDELEQILWHMLNSTTCSDKRVTILETLQDLIQIVTASGGLVVGQDADLSDISVQYLLRLVEQPMQPWIVVNDWQPETGCAVTLYHTPDPTPLIGKMREVLQTGAIFVCLDAQKAKSRMSSTNLEIYLQEQFPDRRILRIDSETVADPNHPACGVADRLNQVAADYDIVIATPTIGTGVSIDLENHFVGVFGIFHGTTPDSESRQALARVRANVPRYVWARSFGLNKIGNGSCSYREVVRSTTQSLRYSLQLLQEIDFDLDAAYDPVTLRTWAKMAARVNASLWRFRESLRRGLEAEGHAVTCITDCDSTQKKSVKKAIATIQIQHTQLQAQKVSEATDLTDTSFSSLREQRTKSTNDRHSESKYLLSQRYGIPVTPELKLRDDNGWYDQLRLHYYLLNDLVWVQKHDLKELTAHLRRGHSKITLQDVKLLSAQVQVLRSLGIPALLNPELEIRACDVLVQAIAQQAVQYTADLKTILNVTITAQMSEMQIIQTLLAKLGLKLKYQRLQRKSDGSRKWIERIYQYELPKDDRDTIFAAWQQREFEPLASPTTEC
jgi:hypothetical protein